MRWAPLVVALPPLLVSLASCADDTRINPVTGPAVGFTAGSRLRPRTRAGDRGSRLLVGWQDTKLSVACQFATAEDGESRCIPSGADLVFQDPLCSQPVAVVDPSCNEALPVFASATFASDACGGAVHAFRLGDPITLASTHVYLGGGEIPGCSHTADLAPGIATYATVPVDPTELVKATLVHETTTDRLGVEVLTADDGARQTRGLFDGDRESDASNGRCFSIAGAIGGGEDRCVPDAIAWATYAADPACKQPVAYQVRPTASCPRADVVVAYASQNCSVSASYFSRGDEVSIDDVFSGVAPTCTSLRAQPSLYNELNRDHRFYGVGAPVAATTFPRLVTTPMGPGRLQVPTLTVDDGTPLAAARPDTFFDTTLGIACRVSPFPDGVARCVPVDAAPITSPAFSDDACTREIVGIAATSGCEGGPPPAYAIRVTGVACGNDVLTTAVLGVGRTTQKLDAFYTVDASGKCVREAGTAGTFADVLDEVPVANLAIVNERVE